MRREYAGEDDQHASRHRDDESLFLVPPLVRHEHLSASPVSLLATEVPLSTFSALSSGMSHKNVSVRATPGPLITQHDRGHSRSLSRDRGRPPSRGGFGLWRCDSACTVMDMVDR